MKRSLFMLFVVLFILLPGGASAQEKDKSIRARIKGLQKMDGYLPLYWDAVGG